MVCVFVLLQSTLCFLKEKFSNIYLKWVWLSAPTKSLGSLNWNLLYSLHVTDFEMSDVRQEHALAVEQLVPRLAALRIELCPNHMSERCFWKIYFMLVYPRLDEKDAEMLFSPQVFFLLSISQFLWYIYGGKWYVLMKKTCRVNVGCFFLICKAAILIFTPR